MDLEKSCCVLVRNLKVTGGLSWHRLPLTGSNANKTCLCLDCDVSITQYWKSVIKMLPGARISDFHWKKQVWWKHIKYISMVGDVCPSGVEMRLFHSCKAKATHPRTSGLDLSHILSAEMHQRQGGHQLNDLLSVKTQQRPPTARHNSASSSHFYLAYIVVCLWNGVYSPASA